MIIQIRGTSGSGKSTVMRQVMERTGPWSPEYVSGRKKPLYCRSVWQGLKLVVLGHYESPCGGCDTIGSARAVFELIDIIHPYDVVLSEGLLLSEDVKWTCQMAGVRPLFLTTDVERCIEQIKGRREEVGNSKPLSEKNTRNRVAVIERARNRLLEAGIDCRRASPEQAGRLILSWLKTCCRSAKT